MQVRWNYKLQPNQGQRTLMGQWLVTLRKHRNYSLHERERGWDTNNRDADTPIHYTYGAHCDIETRIEVGSCCPLTCPVIKSGIIPHQLADEQLLKTTQEKFDKKSGERIPSKVLWDSASGAQSKRTTQLRRESKWYKAIDSGVLQRNLAKLDAAYSGFWHHQRGFPAYQTRANFKSWENKPGRCTFEVNRKPGKKHRYSHITLPGMGRMRYLDSRPLPKNAKVGTVTVKQEADSWYISVLLDSLPIIGRVKSLSAKFVGILTMPILRQVGPLPSEWD